MGSEVRRYEEMKGGGVRRYEESMRRPLVLARAGAVMSEENNEKQD